jgi:transposase
VKQVGGRAVVSWTKDEKWRDWATLNEGCCLLRTNVTDWSAGDLWHAYIQLTGAEAAFRIHKSDLRLRPIWHQKEDRVLAHILVCFLAYVLWKTLHQMTMFRAVFPLLRWAYHPGIWWCSVHRRNSLG